jgi:hypothetical protein
LPRGATTRLFHAIVGLGLAGSTATCGGIAAAPKDASTDVTTSDAVVGQDSGLGPSMPDATAGNDAPSMLIGPDADNFPPMDAGADIHLDFPPDGWIPPVQ